MKNEIIKALKSSDGYISGEMLSKQLGVSRTAVWKAVNALKQDGYVIDSASHNGYKLVYAPELIEKEDILKNLTPSAAGCEIITLLNTDSTNNYLKKLASEGAGHGTTVIAEQQSAGKGRLSRMWYSERGTGIYMSVLLKPMAAPHEISCITPVIGLAVCNAIRKETGTDAKIKWPNDVVIGSKKVAGILTEMSAQSDMIDYIIVGIGINVNNEVFADEIKYKATSLLLETGENFSRAALAAAVLCEINKSLTDGIGFSKVDLEEYKKLCISLDKEVSVMLRGKMVTGRAIGVNSGGELVVRLPDGELMNISCGEVGVSGVY